MIRLFAVTALPLAVELLAPALASAAEAPSSSPSSARSAKKDARSDAKEAKHSKDSKKSDATSVVHRQRATAVTSHGVTDVKVDVHIDGSKKKPSFLEPSPSKALDALAAAIEAKPKNAPRDVDVEVDSVKADRADRAGRSETSDRSEKTARHEKHTGRGDHAVEPTSSPKVEASLDPTIHFVPMSATTMAPIDVSVDVKTSDKADKSDKPEKIEKSDKTEKSAPIDKAEKSDKADKSDGRKIDKKPLLKKKEKTCLSSAVDVLRGVEEEKVALTKCDGEIAPGAVELMSILVRPQSASRPIASLSDLLKAKGAEIAPGVKRIDPLLVTHLEEVVEHFGKLARRDGSDAPPKVFVISGYRPRSKGSFHQSGKALDFRLDGVKNEELVAYCKTLQDVGCGYYPNSSFVHMDVRVPGTGHVAWIDASGPGESPSYVSAWPPPADRSDKADKKETLAKNDPDAADASDDDAPRSAADAKTGKPAMAKAGKSGKHVGPFDIPPLPSEEHAADPEAISDMSQPGIDE